MLFLGLAVLICALSMGARAGGVALGLWGAVGMLMLVVGFSVPPGAIPGEVILTVLSVIMASSAREVAGGVDFLVRVAERIICKNPKQVTIIAPLVTYGFSFASGAGHVVYPLRSRPRKRHSPERREQRRPLVLANWRGVFAV